MKLTGITYKSLCRCLAETEIGLRRGAKVNTAREGGRADQLAYMEQNFPNEWVEYRSSLEERLANPFDSQTVINAILRG